MLVQPMVVQPILSVRCLDEGKHAKVAQHLPRAADMPHKQHSGSCQLNDPNMQKATLGDCSLTLLLLGVSPWAMYCPG